MNRELILLLLVAAAVPAQAQSLQCGTGIVSEGATRVEVLAKCGDPTFVDKGSISRSSSGGLVGLPIPPGGGSNTTIEVPVEVWLYNLGPDKLMEQLRFVDGRVVKIETLGYGYL
jgi:hypothetical protein